jgi:hypothetical protein
MTSDVLKSETPALKPEMFSTMHALLDHIALDSDVAFEVTPEMPITDADTISVKAPETSVVAPGTSVVAPETSPTSDEKTTPTHVTLHDVLELLRHKCLDYHKRYAAIFGSMEKNLQAPFSAYVEAVVNDPLEWLHSFPMKDTSEPALAKSKTALLFLLGHATVRADLGTQVCDQASEILTAAWQKNKKQMSKEREQLKGRQQQQQHQVLDVTLTTEPAGENVEVQKGQKVLKALKDQDVEEIQKIHRSASGPRLVRPAVHWAYDCDDITELEEDTGYEDADSGDKEEDFEDVEDVEDVDEDSEECPHDCMCEIGEAGVAGEAVADYVQHLERELHRRDYELNYALQKIGLLKELVVDMARTAFSVDSMNNRDEEGLAGKCMRILLSQW